MAQHQLHVRSAELEKALPIYGYYVSGYIITVLLKHKLSLTIRNCRPYTGR